MNATWYNISMFYALWLLPIIILIFVYAAWKKKQTLKMFASTAMLAKLTANLSPTRRFLKAMFFVLCILFIILAMARPAWNPVPRNIKREGRDIIFILDVSRSMLADDLKPSRLERAKLAIDDCIDILEGDRVGLIVFAGNAVIRCPLTQDYGFFRMMLSDVDTDSVSRGGTLIGDALRKADNEMFDNEQRQYKDIILITDGEDHESFPLEAAKKIGAKGVRLIAIGLGNDSTGTPIMVKDENGHREMVQYHGEIVRSRLDSDTLRSMVNATNGGRYLPVATGNINLGTIYHSLIANAAKREIESQTIERYEEKFQIFLLTGMIFLALSILIYDRKKTVLKAVLLILCFGIFAAHASEDSLKQGNKLFLQENYPEALKAYQEASITNPESPYLHYNRGIALYRQEKFTDAEKALEKALDSTRDLKKPNPPFEAKCRLALGDTYYRLGQRQKDSDLKKSIEACEKSIREYEDVLRLNPDLEVARKNVDTVRLILKKFLNDQKKQMQKQQQMQKQRQEQIKKLDKLSKEQKQAAQQSQQAQQKQDSSEQTQQQMQSQQQKLNQDTKEVSEQQKQQAQTPDDNVQKKLEEAQKNQQQAQKDLDKKDYENAEKHQEEAAKNLKDAKDELQKQQEQEQQKQQQEAQKEKQAKQAQQQKQDSKQDSKETAKKQQAQQQKQEPESESPQQQKPQDQLQLNDDPQNILNEERKNQRKRQSQRGPSPRPVDKNW